MAVGSYGRVVMAAGSHGRRYLWWAVALVASVVVVMVMAVGISAGGGGSGWGCGECGE